MPCLCSALKCSIIFYTYARLVGAHLTTRCKKSKSRCFQAICESLNDMYLTRLDIHKSGVCRDSFRIFVIKGVAEVLITKLGKRVMTNIAI